MDFLDGRQQIADIRALIEALEDVQRAQTPEEDAAAKLRLEVECALSHATSMERARRRALDMIGRPIRRDTDPHPEGQDTDEESSDGDGP